MSRKLFIAAAVAALVILSLFAGCAGGPAPEKPAEEVVTEGFTKLSSLKSAKYNLAFKGDIVDSSSENVKFDFTLNGSFDFTDKKDAQLDLNFVGSGSDGSGMGGSLDAQLMLSNAAAYFNVKSLDLDGEENAIPEDAKEMFGKWWKVTLPPGTLDEITESVPVGEDNAAIKKAFEDAKVIDSPEYLGTEDVMGESSYHYRITVNKKGLVQFLKAVSESQGETVSAAELAEAEKELENINIKGDVWVGTKSNMVNQFKGSVDVLKSSDGSTGTMEIGMSLGNINQAFAISAPSEAEEFPLEALMGPMMMMDGGY